VQFLSYLCTVKGNIRDIAARLEAAYDADEAEGLAWWVAEEVTGLSRAEIIYNAGVSKLSEQKIEEVIERLLRHEPVQYVFGHTLWNGLDLKVTPATLIPRPETAELVEKIGKNYELQITNYELQNTHLKVLDIGTGSGCIAIAIKKAHPEWEVTGIDISAEAIEVARENAVRNGVEVTFEVADIFSKVIPESAISNQLFDIVVSNPPYICEKEKNSMESNVLDYEPGTALFVPDEDPLLFYRRIAELKAGRALFFEINEAYGAEVAQLLCEKGYTDVQIIQDMYGKDRIVTCRMA